MNWDELWMNMVHLIAMKSRDPSSHIGALIVTPDNRLISAGYNGFPRGVEYEDSKRQERPTKYFYYEHAERNACYLARQSVEGCIMYTSGTPCADCARAIIQSGIKEVVVDAVWDSMTAQDKWTEHAKHTIVMFREAGVKLRAINVKPVQISRFFRGKIIE